MTWTAHYRNSFRLVDRETWEEGAELWEVTGGTLEMSAFSDAKVSATLEFAGDAVPDSRSLVRVYHSYSEAGAPVERALATLVFSVSEAELRGPVASGTMECQSVLAWLSSKMYGAPFTIPAGAQAVQLASQLVASVGLRSNCPDPSAYVVKSPVTVEREDASYLGIVNRLLGMAGYASAWVDAYGVVQMTPYVEPTERPPAIALSDAAGGCMYPEMAVRREWAGTPNAVRLYYETEEEALAAWALNVDPSHQASIPYRGFEATFSDGVSELSGETQAERLAELEAKAASMLADKTTDIEYVDGACMYRDGLEPNNAIAVEYARAGLSWKGAVTSVRLVLGKSLKAEFSARRFVKQGMQVETGSEVVW